MVLGDYRSSERMVVSLMQRIGWARFKWLCWGSGIDPKRTFKDINNDVIQLEFSEWKKILI